MSEARTAERSRTALAQAFGGALPFISAQRSSHRALQEAVVKPPQPQVCSLALQSEYKEGRVTAAEVRRVFWKLSLPLGTRRD